MAGQEEFHAFHDFMLPNLDGTSYPSLFLLVCNPLKHVQGNLQEAILNIQGELDYWLRFIASKNRPSIIFKPKAIVVFTHSNKIDVNAHAPEIVTNLNTKFAKVVDVASKPVAIDSHSSRSAQRDEYRNYGLCTQLPRKDSTLHRCKVLLLHKITNHEEIVDG
jgi:hypothetical protein